MTEKISSSEIFNSFNMFREILTGITALSTLNPKWALDKYYLEDLPKLKGVNSKGFPFMLIETEVNHSYLTMKNKKKIACTTKVSIHTEYSIEVIKEQLNSYMNAIVYYFDANKNTIRLTYDMQKLTYTKVRENDTIHQKELVVGKITFNYHTTVDTSS